MVFNTRFISSLMLISFITLLLSFKTKNQKHKNKTAGQKENQSTNNKHINPSFLVISDIHLFGSLLQNDTIPGLFDNAKKPITVTRNSDTGHDLWDTAKAEINTIIKNQKPKFIIVLGDITRHEDSTKVDSVSVRQNIKGLISYFKDSANIPADIPMVYVAGNNDSWNGDYSSYSLPDSVTNNGYPFLHVDAKPSQTHACIADNSLRKLACYSIYPLGRQKKLKLVVLNTIIFTKEEKYPYSNNDPTQQNADAATMLHWLSGQLLQAKNNNEQVLLAMHVPIGTNVYHKKNEAGDDFWFQASMVAGKLLDVKSMFLQLIEKYKKNIIGLLAGHSHMDGLTLLRKKAADPAKDSITALLISVPGIAPGHGNNPAMKLIEYKPANSFALQNFTTYYMPYWKEQKVTNWDSSFNFRQLNNTGNMSMLQYFQQKKLDKATVQKYVTDIYRVYGKQLDTTRNTINSTTIYVDYK